jgi:cytidyltransferase-like protein
MIIAVDIYLLIKLINYKIFKLQINTNLLIIPLLFSVNNTITFSYVISLIINFIQKLSKILKINIFKIEYKKKRVFCCGVFDMCHFGHMVLFEKIYKSFNEPIELIVGIHSDKTVSEYKREPIINENIRYKTISYCRHVDTIIIDCPLIITKEYILLNNLDVVIIGEEYKGNKDIEWYPGAFELNNFMYISRCDDISTTEIINKIKLYNFTF